MKKEKKYFKKKFVKIKFNLVIIAFALLIVICTIGIFLNFHLFAIQKVERLNKVKDYSEYKMKLEFLTDSDEYSERLIYETENERFYLSGVKEIYVYYGSTNTTLKDAFEKGYLTLEILKDNLTGEIGNGYTKYAFKGSNNEEEQYVMYEFERENDKTDYYFTTI